MALIACYCRVSTRHQKNDSQRAEIGRWLKNSGLDLSAVRWFEDKETGTTSQRLAFGQMQKAIFESQVKTVVVWKLDRISRRQREGINLLADWCDRGVRVVSVTQQIDLSGAVGHMVASVMIGLAEIELEYRCERQAAGIKVAKKKSRRISAPCVIGNMFHSRFLPHILTCLKILFQIGSEARKNPEALPFVFLALLINMDWMR